MSFTHECRTDVDAVERSFVEYKIKYPEQLEFLVPTLTAATPFTTRPISNRRWTDEDNRKATALAPWGYTFDLAPEARTDNFDHAVIGTPISNTGWSEVLVRAAMLDLAIEKFMPRGSWLDLATNCGFLPILLDVNATHNITGIDISSKNVAKAYFLKDLSGRTDLTFLTSDVFEYLNACQDGQFDVVTALGLFYHLSDPLGLAQLIFRKCRQVAMIETTIHNFPFSGWIQTISRHTKFEHLKHANDTRKIYELHPTYRGLIDTLYQVGFSEIHEIVPSKDILAANPGTLFETMNRRLLIGIKH